MITELYKIQLTLNNESKRNIYARATNDMQALRFACDFFDITLNEVLFALIIPIPMTEN